MLALSLTLNVLCLVALGVLVALCRDLGALAHDLMDPTQRAKLRPPLLPNTLSAKVLAWLMRRRFHSGGSSAGPPSGWPSPF